MLRALFVAGMLLLGLHGVASARYIQWKRHEKPPLSLLDAVTLADKEVAKQPEKYHCIAASLAKTFTNGDWELRYSTADDKELWVSVGSDKLVRLSPGAFEY